MSPMDESVLKGFKYFKPLWPILKKLPAELKTLWAHITANQL